MSVGRSINFGVFVPQGWRMDLVEIPDPVEKYETMSRVAQAAHQAGYDSILVFDHFHTVATPKLETTFECWRIGMFREACEIIHRMWTEPLRQFAQEVMPRFRS